MIGRCIMTIRTIRVWPALALFCAVGAGQAYADCSALYGIAQQHANDMARRNSLDHSGFMKRRGPVGAVAENVAVGCDTEACARQVWMKSSRHRSNMMLGGCQAIASAVSSSGRRYWVMEIGGGGNGIAGRDFSIEGSNAP
jgi:Cysteine-rich secretory protein family